MFVFFLFTIFFFISFLFSEYTGDKIGFALLSIGSLIFALFFDYFLTISVERDIPISYELLTQEGDIINSYSNNPLLKTDKMISVENMNQTQEFIKQKSEWVRKVKIHNTQIQEIVWKYDQPNWFYLGYGLRPFKSKEDAKSYLINLK